jgi:hypothetical protein
MSVYASSPIAERGFCAACGSPLTFRYIEADGISVTIGSLDEPDAVTPSQQFGMESVSAHWHDLQGLPGQTCDEAMPADWAEKMRSG